jgi:hypothetical protein
MMPIALSRVLSLSLSHIRQAEGREEALLNLGRPPSRDGASERLI